MPVFDKELWDYEYDEDTATVRINAMGSIYGPTIEDYPEVFARVIDILREVGGAASIVLASTRDYEYSGEQAEMLVEIADLIQDLTRQGYLTRDADLPACQNYFPVWRSQLQRLFVEDLRSDPVGAYVKLRREIRHKKEEMEDAYNEQKKCYRFYIKQVLVPIRQRMEETRLIQQAQDYITGYHVGDREIYREFFHPLVRPNFMLTKYQTLPPEQGEEVDRYTLPNNNVDVQIFKVQDQADHIYHMTPPEFELSEDHYTLLDAARRYLASHRPETGEFAEPERMRDVFSNIGKDMIGELSDRMNIPIGGNEIDELTNILTRYTAGLGVLELVLADTHVQDVYLNAPIGQNPMFLFHGDYEECRTNLIPTLEDAESWATRFRIRSGRPLDEANPVLDTELEVPGGRARVAIITRNLSPTGLAFAFRRHRDDPWTLPLFIENNYLNGLSAGLLSFLIDGARSILYAGTRSAGKCVSGDTMIQLGDGRVKPIRELVGVEKEVIEDGTIHEPVETIDTPSMQNSLGLETEPVTDVWKREAPEKLVRIETRSGREIVTTPEHPYFTFDAGVQQKRADALEEDVFIATPRTVAIDGGEQDIAAAELESYRGETGAGMYRLRSDNASVEIQFPKTVTPEIAEFIGLITGDGSINKKKLEFHNSCEAVRQRYVELLEQFDVPYRVYESHSTTVVQVTNRTLTRALQTVFDIPFGKKSDAVTIPSRILQSPDHVLAAFIRGYFDADSYVSGKKREIELATASKEMMEQLRHALLRFGITCYTKEKTVDETPYYRVFIRGRFVEEFADSIGVNHPEKAERLTTVLEENTVDNTNIDAVPEGGRFLRELRSRLRVSPNEVREATGKDYWSYENEEYRVTRQWFEKLVAYYRERFEALQALQPQIDMLRRFVEADYDMQRQRVKTLRDLLGISYAALAAETGVSGTGVRTMLNGGVADVAAVNRLHTALDTVENRFTELRSVSSESFTVTNIPVLAEHDAVTYAELEEKTGIPSNMIHYYAHGECTPPPERAAALDEALQTVKKRLVDTIQDAASVLSDTNGVAAPDAAQIGAVLARFRDRLNIEKTEYAEEGISPATVSNFFTGRFANPEMDTVKALAQATVAAYDEAVSSETRELLTQAEQLASSDIFWDQVAAVEFVEPEEDTVYDLTVPETHNFVANGFIAHNTSLLGASIAEIMKRNRIISVEDTLEIPIPAYKELGYNAQRMKSRSVITQVEGEMPADEAIRTSLRLGDSVLLLGEVRSKEAQALYEAMRIGAVANYVAGTIHGESAYSVFDRVVNDLGVPKTSFKATDVIVISNRLKSADGLHTFRRVTDIVEVRKEWTEDPQAEGAFVPLMQYNAEEDQLEPTETFMNGESEVLNDIAQNVPEWRHSWDAVWNNIKLRQRVKEEIVEVAQQVGDRSLMEAAFVVKANERFRVISEAVNAESGEANPEEIFARWRDWLHREAGVGRTRR